MAFSLQVNEANIKVIFEEDVRVDQARGLWEQLMKAGVPDSVLTIDAKACRSVDFSILQLLWAARALAKSLVVENPSAAFVGSLDRAGMRRAFREALRGQQ